MRAFINKHSGLAVWLSFLIYGVCAALFVEFILLPYLIPQLHAGEGFIKENPDSRTYHSLACNLLRHFDEVGWRFWELRPVYSSPSAIAAVFYRFFGEKLWVLIPYQSIVQATSGFLIYQVFALSGFRYKISAYLGAIAFMVFPVSILMLTQLQKDGVYILGTLGVVYSVLLISQEKWKFNKMLFAAAIWLLGAFLIWWFRSDRLIIPLMASGVVLCFFLILSCVRWMRARNAVDLIYLSKIVLFLVVICGGFVVLSKSYHKPYITNRHGLFKDSRFEIAAAHHIESVSKSLEDDNDVDRPQSEIWGRSNWQYSRFIPRSIENRIVDVVATRMSFYRLHPKSKSFLDRDIFIYSLKDFILHQPRNLQVAYFAPFPSNLIDGGIFQKVVLVEMLVYYLCFFVLAVCLYFLRRNRTFWTLVTIHLIYSSIYAFAIPNMGAFHRQRYLLFTLIIGLAIALFSEVILKVKNGEKLKE